MKQEAIESSTVAILDLILTVQLNRLVLFEKENSRTCHILLGPVLLVASLQPWSWFTRGGGGFPPPPFTFLPIHPDVGVCNVVPSTIAFLAEHIPGEEIGSWERLFLEKIDMPSIFHFPPWHIDFVGVVIFHLLYKKNVFLAVWGWLSFYIWILTKGSFTLAQWLF